MVGMKMNPFKVVVGMRNHLSINIFYFAYQITYAPVFLEIYKQGGRDVLSDCL